MTPPSSPLRTAWLMLLVLISAFAMSQAFRTAAAVVAAPLQQAFGLTPGQLGLFAGAFHFAFAGLQLFMGTGIDVWGTRRTVLAVFPLAAFGAVITAMADSYTGLIVGQALTGIGCAPAFLACTVFIARRFPADRYARVNGAALSLGSIGLLLTGTPLAWVVQAWDWRAGYFAMAACAAAAWLAILLLVREEPRADGARPSMLTALRGYGELFRLPHTWGIIGLGVFTYASFLSLRGLWLGPMLIERHGFSLVATGHVALVISVLGLAAPALFGRLDPGEPRRRRRWLLSYTLACAAMFALVALPLGAAADVILSLAIGFVSGYMVMQYADVRAAYSASMTGRAMAVFTMAMFMGVALMQSFTGWVASAAASGGMEPYGAVMGAIAAMLVVGAALFRLLPQPAALSAGTGTT